MAIPHLLNRNGIYYFRRAIPRNLRHIINKREIIRSLGTGNKQEALPLAMQLALQVNQLFNEAKIVSRKRTKNKIPDDMNSFFVETTSKPDGTTVQKFTSDPDGDPAFELKAHRDYLRELKRNATSCIDEETSTNCIPLSEMIDKYFTEREKEGAWKPESESEYIKIFERFLAIVGDLPSDKILHPQALHYKEILMSWPAHAGKQNRYKGLTPMEIVKAKPPEAKTIAIGTINKNITIIGGLFNWGERQGYCNKNCFAGLTLLDKERSRDKKNPFSESDLDRLFSTDLFLLCKPKPNCNYTYWFPLISLFSGLRLEEVCQLRVDEIGQGDENGIWYFDTNDSDRVKNKQSRRKVPVHRKLIDLGLLQYVDQLKKQNEIQLFPELKKKLVRKRDGTKVEGKRGSTVSKWFNARYAVKCGVKTDKKSVHSFRHTLINALKQKRFRTSEINSISGHHTPGMVDDVYSDDYHLSTKRELIEAINFKIPQIKAWSKAKGT